MKRTPLLIVMALWPLSTSPATAQVGGYFEQGRTRFSLTAGYGSLNEKNYGVVGVGAGYYFLEGLEAGVDGEAWIGNKPHIYTVSPETRYILNYSEAFKPYLGGFVKRTFYDDLPNRNSAGGRAGFISPLGTRTYLSAGLVYEKIFDCDKNLYDSCTLVYPEVGLSFSY